MSTQTEFAYMQSVMETLQPAYGWLITVFDDGDPRTLQTCWKIEDDVIYMSDNLYALQCAFDGTPYTLERGVCQ